MAAGDINPNGDPTVVARQLLDRFKTRKEALAYINKMQIAVPAGADPTMPASLLAEKVRNNVQREFLRQADEIETKAKTQVSMGPGEAAPPKGNFEVEARKKEIDAQAAEMKKNGADPAKVDASSTQAKTGLGSTSALAAVPTPGPVQQYTGGNDASPEQKAAIIASFNVHHPDRQVKTWEEVVPHLQNSRDPAVSAVLDEALLDPVQTTYVFKLPPGVSGPGNGTVSITANEYGAIQKYYGGRVDQKELQQLVNVAARNNVWGANGHSGAVVLASIAQASKMYDLKGDYADLVTTKNRTRERGMRGSRGPDVARMKGSGPAVSKADQQTMAEQSYILAQKALLYNDGIARYNNEYLAYLHALKPSLALKLSTTKKSNWSRDDVIQANALFVDGGLVDVQSNWHAMGYATGENIALDISTKANGMGNGSGATRQVADPVQLRQATKDMYQQLFFKDPTDAELDQFTQQVQAAVGGAPDNQSVSPEARIRDSLEHTPQFAELYKNRPSGMSVSDYSGQFRAAAQSMLGNEAADPAVIRSGLRTGDYQTTIGAAAMSGKAFGNSTFLGRLAQAAQIISENT